MKTALITGITGQDGTYLAQYLLSLDYQVYGLVRGQNNPKLPALHMLLPDLQLVEGDLLDQGSLVAAVAKLAPDEVYNLGSISFVPLSWKQPELVAGTTGMGVLRMLEAIRIASGNGRPDCRFYQASSSEMFGMVRETPQTENTPFHPRSPYGAAKAFGHYMTVNYRESYGMHASSGILFNHESPRRGLEFVSRKITSSAARIKLKLQSELVLGNTEAQRDWGYAGDYVRAMHLMLQQPEGGDYVIATGETHSVQECLELAFACVGLDWEQFVRRDERFLRPAEVDVLRGDASKARRELGWEPRVNFRGLVEMMVEEDLRIARESPEAPLVSTN